MLKVDEKTIKRMEERYPGIAERIIKIENEKLPECSHCGSEDTAETNCGIVGYTINLATATSKFHLLPNDKPGKYYCNSCKKYFD